MILHGLGDVTLQTGVALPLHIKRVRIRINPRQDIHWLVDGTPYFLRHSETISYHATVEVSDATWEAFDFFNGWYFGTVDRGRKTFPFYLPGDTTLYACNVVGEIVFEIRSGLIAVDPIELLITGTSDIPK